MPGGRCEACGGDGRVRVDLQFLADAYLICESCGGRRYRPSVLEVRWRGRSIDEVLELTVREALQLFAGQHRVTRRLKVLDQIGLGYLRLGSRRAPSPAARRSASSWRRTSCGGPGPRVLYVLDEPTTGLHMGDVDELLKALQRLLDGGATLVVIEHNLHVIKQADWVIDLGPEGGEAGRQRRLRGYAGGSSSPTGGGTPRATCGGSCPAGAGRHRLTAFRAIWYHRRSWRSPIGRASARAPGRAVPAPWRSPSS